MPLLATFGGGSARGFGRGLAVAGAAKVGIFSADSNSANLWSAVPLTTYQSGSTGGGFIDVSPQIRGNTAGQTAGTAKSYNQGTATITSGSVFSHYGNALAFPSSYAATTDLTYTSSTLSSSQSLTVECRIFVPSGTASGTLIQTNNFSGGYYCCWVWYVEAAASPRLAYFSNYGTTTGTVYSTGTLTRNAWNHVAMSCNGSNMKMFINGTKSYDSTYGNNANGAGPTTIGPSYWDGFGSAIGYKMNDYRVYTGLQKYTADFTVSDTNPDFGGAIIAA